jgi:hypothetical protein
MLYKLDINSYSQVQEIPRVSNVTKDVFSLFASGMQPVVVTDATKNWTALQNFSYDFFHNIYQNVIGKENIDKSIDGVRPYT